MVEAVGLLFDELDDPRIALCPTLHRNVPAFPNYLSYHVYLSYHALPHLPESESSGAAPPGADAAVSCVNWPQAAELGATALPNTQHGVEVLWVIPDEAIEVARRE
ncbi:hypothetical protein [Bogoriella caseilytica]|uniref:Uncharacterized protein n=1 Tax=Bogoriella caseilytica TaxID=56055 RepID=A0A3N2BA02_9MICO|nr:hypothetical protein [Bogoriella caseilytica]ROR72085.1 hypothetical protein EDD31_0431 [Bogoriella caseilytica]